MYKKIVAYILLFILLGCGYKPLSLYSRAVLGKKVYANVNTSLSDPRNSVILQDAVNEAVVERFGSNLVEKPKAQTFLDVSISSYTFTPIKYDSNGYVTSYKTKVILKIITTLQSKKKLTHTTQGEYDFSIEANSVISDSMRFKAIKEASLSAFDEYAAYLAAKGLTDGKHN